MTGWVSPPVDQRGCIGHRSEIQIKNLAELNEAFEKLAKLEGYAEWGKKLEPNVVSGTNDREICRVVE